MSEEWGPWIDHDGKGCPCRGLYVQVVRRSGEVVACIAGTMRSYKSGRVEFYDGIINPLGSSSWKWGFRNNGEPKDEWQLNLEVVCYRIRKPRGLQILQDIAEGIREPEDA